MFSHMHTCTHLAEWYLVQCHNLIRGALRSNASTSRKGFTTQLDCRVRIRIARLTQIPNNPLLKMSASNVWDYLCMPLLKPKKLTYQCHQCPDSFNRQWKCETTQSLCCNSVAHLFTIGPSTSVSCGYVSLLKPCNPSLGVGSVKPAILVGYLSVDRSCSDSIIYFLKIPSTSSPSITLHISISCQPSSWTSASTAQPIRYYTLISQAYEPLCINSTQLWSIVVPKQSSLSQKQVRVPVAASPVIPRHWPNFQIYIGYAELAWAFWDPFKTDELGRFENDIMQCKKGAREEKNHALHQTIFQEQQLQLIDWKAASQHRNFGSILRAKSDKLNEEEQRWRIQTDERKASTWGSSHLPGCQFLKGNRVSKATSVGKTFKIPLWPCF